MTNCDICLETFDTSRIQCECNISCCKTCYIKYLNYSTRCYNCNINWSIIDIHDSVNIIDFNEFLKHQVLSIENDLRQNIQRYNNIDRFLNTRSLISSLKKIKNQYRLMTSINNDNKSYLDEINKDIDTLTRQLNDLIPNAYRLYTIDRLSAEDIIPYMNSVKYEYVCHCGGLVVKNICLDCNRMIEDESLYSRPCPGCLTPIMKIDGCNDMHCVACNTPFNWRTLDIIVGDYHNPHMYESLNNNSYLDDLEDLVISNDKDQLKLIRIVRELTGFDRQPPTELLIKGFIARELLKCERDTSDRQLVFRLLDQKLQIIDNYSGDRKYYKIMMSIYYILSSLGYTVDSV